MEIAVSLLDDLVLSWITDERSLSASKYPKPLVIPPLAKQRESVRQTELLLVFAENIESRLSEAISQLDRTGQTVLARAFRGKL